MAPNYSARFFTVSAMSGERIKLIAWVAIEDSQCDLSDSAVWSFGDIFFTIYPYVPNRLLA